MCIFSNNNKKKSISFLLGAGFSVPAGYPTGKELGECILKTTKDDILTFFNDLYFKYDSHEKYIDFLVELLSICKKYKDFFNYENFYDFIKNPNNDSSFLLNIIFEKIGITGKGESISNTMYQIDEIYNLLVAFYIKETLINALYQRHYKNFVDIIKTLKDTHTVNVHSLNHDLLFEKLLGNGNYTDGFSILNSEYYESYHRQIPFYANDYKSSNIRLYKLHGSIDYFRTIDYSSKSERYNYIKLPHDVSRKNVRNNNGRCIYELHSDFLTGINFKRTRYKEHFYSNLHRKFISNLASADKLIIIGYSGNDGGINDYIIDNLKRDEACFVLDYKEDEAKEVIRRIGLCTKRKDIRCYAVKSDLENVKESDFEETTYAKSICIE